MIKNSKRYISFFIILAFLVCNVLLPSNFVMLGVQEAYAAAQEVLSLDKSEVIAGDSITATVYSPDDADADLYLSLWDTALNKYYKTAEHEKVVVLGSTDNQGKAKVSLEIPAGVDCGNYQIELMFSENNKYYENLKVSKNEKELEVKKLKDYRAEIEAAIEEAAQYAEGSYSDWTTVGLARTGNEELIPADYLEHVEEYLKANDGEFRKPTEYERLTLGILAAGGDPTNIGGYNLIEKIYNADLAWQGNNAFIFGLIALDAGEYKIPADAEWNRDKLVQVLVDAECSNEDNSMYDGGRGGWAFYGSNGDPDMTGMAMIALAPYNNDKYPQVQEAIARAIEYLSAIQYEDGEFRTAYGTGGPESIVQALMGLCLNNEDPIGEKFTKGDMNLIDALLSYRTGEGFAHTKDYGFKPNGMANEQALYGLAQYLYYLDGKGSIYHWGDKNPEESPEEEKLDPAKNWTQFGANSHNTGVSPAKLCDSLVKLWDSENIDGAVSSSPIVVKDKVYARGWTSLTCLDKNTGKTIWSKDVPGDGLGGWHTPSYHNGKIFLGAGSKLFCFKAEDGTEEWNIGLNGPVCNSSTKVVKGNVLVGNWDGHTYYCVDEKTGDIKWQFELDEDGYAQGTPGYADGKVYFTSWNQRYNAKKDLYCVDLKTGKEQWAVDALEYGNNACGSPTIANGTVYISGYNFGGLGQLAAVDTETGTLKWQVEAPQTDATPAYHNGYVYISGGCPQWGYGTGNVACYDAENGNEIWNIADVGNWTNSTVIADGKLFAGVAVNGEMEYQGIKSIDLDTHEIIWESKDGGATPAIADGQIFTIANGKVYAYGEGIEIKGIQDEEIVINPEVTFTVTTSTGISIQEVKLGADVIELNEDGTYTAILKEGPNKITIIAKDKEAKEIKKTFTVTYHKEEPILYKVSLEIKDDKGELVIDSNITIKDDEDKVVDEEDDGTYKLKAGEYSYIIAKEGFEEATGTITVCDEDVSEIISLKRVEVISLREKVENAIAGAAKLAPNNNHSSDWAVIGLARTGNDELIPADYLAEAEQYVRDNKGEFSEPTQYERITLGVLAAGGDPTNVAGYNLIEKIYNADLENQGINALVYGLIALDAQEYQVPTNAKWNREKIINKILELECSNEETEYGKKAGWVYGADNADSDMTGMALTALAPYNNDKFPKVQAAIERALDWLRFSQREDGSFATWGTSTSESCAQVLMGLCTNRIDPTGEEFTINGKNVVSALLSFELENHRGFAHVSNEGDLQFNGMANEQALYALAQYIYYLDGKGSIYHWEKDSSGTDKMAPKIALKDLEDGQVVETQQVIFKVKVTDNVDYEVVPVVKQGDVVLKPNEEGEYTVNLNKGRNIITISATDKAQNTKTMNVTVYYMIPEFEVERIGSADFKKGHEAHLRIKAKNISGNEQEATLIIVLFRETENKMINYSYVTKNIVPNGSEELAGGFVIPETGSYQVKGFVWDNMENRNILGKPIVVEVTD